MGFIILFATGGILGWLASILARSDDGRGIALNIVLGMVGALIGGALGSSESLLLGLSAEALLLALLGAVVLLAGFNAARRSLPR